MGHCGFSEGKGDLVLSNGTMFLLVETQYLTSLSGATKGTKRAHKRGEIRESHIGKRVAVLFVVNMVFGMEHASS